MRGKHLQYRREIHIAEAELAELPSLESFQMHVSDERREETRGLETIDAAALEVDRIEIHPKVGPVGALEDLAANLRASRRAVVVLKHKTDAWMPLGQPLQIAA